MAYLYLRFGFVDSVREAFCLADLNKISVTDLENIQETETPPQSPTDPDDLAVQMSATVQGSSVAYSKSAREKIPEETDSTDEKHDSTPTQTPPKRSSRNKRQSRKMAAAVGGNTDEGANGMNEVVLLLPS